MKPQGPFNIHDRDEERANMPSHSPPPGPGPPSHSFFTMREPPKKQSEEVNVPQISFSYSDDAKGHLRTTSGSSMDSGSSVGQGASLRPQPIPSIASWEQEWSTPAPRNRSASPKRGSPVRDRVYVPPSPSTVLNRVSQLHPRVKGTEQAVQLQQHRPFMSDDVMRSVENGDISTNVAKEFSKLTTTDSKEGSTTQTQMSGSLPVVHDSGSSGTSVSTHRPGAASSTTDISLKHDGASLGLVPILTLKQATERLRLFSRRKFVGDDGDTFGLRIIPFSVAFYTPLGSLLQPLQTLQVQSNTHLDDAILTLQEMLLENLKLAGSDARLLVQGIQFRKLDMVGFDDLPRIEGMITGPKSKDWENVRGGRMSDDGVGFQDEKLRGGTTCWVSWDANFSNSEMVSEIKSAGQAGLFWKALIKKMLQDDRDRSERREEMKLPLLKIRTVLKAEKEEAGENREGARGGGHYFWILPDAVLPSPLADAENTITPRGSIAGEGSGGSLAAASNEYGTSLGDPLAENEPSTLYPERKIQEEPTKYEPSVSNFKQDFTHDPRRTSLKHDRSSPDSTFSFPSTQRRRGLRKRADARRVRRPQPLGISLGSYMPAEFTDGKSDAAAKALQHLNLNTSRNLGRSKSDSAKEAASKTEKMNTKTQPGVPAPTSNTSTAAKEDAHGKRSGIKDHQREKDYYLSVVGGRPNIVVDPEHNWEMYQSWGEKPSDPGYRDRKELHELFSLRHIPFYGPWGKGITKRKGVKEIDEDEILTGDYGTAYQMVPYAFLNPKILARLTLESLNDFSNLSSRTRRYWEDHYNAKGLAEIDDDTFFPASNPELVRELVRKYEAGRLFEARAFRNPSRTKFDLKSLVSNAKQRVSSNQGKNKSKYLDALAAEKILGVHDDMSGASAGSRTPKLGTGKTVTTFTHSHAAADNVFQSTMKGVGSFSSFSKQAFRPVEYGRSGFYELSRRIANHTPTKDVDSFVADLHLDMHGNDAPKGAQEESRPIIPGSSFSDFNALANDFVAHQSVSAYGESTVRDDGSNPSRRHIFRPETATDAIATNSPRGGGNNQIPSSFGHFGGMHGGGPADFRSPSLYDTQLPINSINQQGWTSMNTAGPTYNSFGGQAQSYNSTLYNTPRDTSAFPQYNSFNQSIFATAAPAAQHRSRIFNPMDSNRITPGHERFAFNNMAIPSSNPNHPAAGSFVNPHSTPTHPSHPHAGYFHHGGNGPSHAHLRTHGLHFGSNPAAASRVRRPIPIRLPPGNSTQQFQLPSPTRQAINYGAGPDRVSLGLSPVVAMGTSVTIPPFLRHTPSPEKKAFQKASMAEFSAAIESAFNGPKGNPSARKMV